MDHAEHQFLDLSLEILNERNGRYNSRFDASHDRDSVRTLIGSHAENPKTTDEHGVADVAMCK